MTIKCLVIDSDEEAIAMLEQVVKKIQPVEIVEYCRTSRKIVDTLSDNKIDLVFIDPHMDGINGHLQTYEDVLKAVPYIVVMSTDRTVAQKAFDINAIDFLLKPLTANRLIRSLSKVAKSNSRQAKGQAMREHSPLFVKDKSVLVRVEMRDIYLIEALADYVNIYTAKKKYTVHLTMKKMETMLNEHQFVRVHKSFIVRIDAIKEVENNKLVVEGRSVPISNTYRKKLLDNLKII